MKTHDFYYELPEELIAQDPLEDRASSRLMVLDKQTGRIEHKIFRQIKDYLRPGDCLVINDTKVIPARLIGEKLHEGQQPAPDRDDSKIPGKKVNQDKNASAAGNESVRGARIELLLLKRRENDIWETLVKPGKKAKPGTRISFGGGIMTAEIIDCLEDGNRLVKFYYKGIFEEILDRLGQMPLPPYITHPLADKNRYQTVYAKYEGSAAAPTAGLHFTQELLEEIKAMGVHIVSVTLHVGLGTFRPVKVEDVSQHHMHSEFYIVTREAADEINRVKAAGGRIICVGTTSCRTVESAADEQGIVHPGSNETSIFIYPGYHFKVMDGLITNFHLPESTLIMLVSAFAGREKIMAAYNEAVKERYRFYSFGDAMFIK